MNKYDEKLQRITTHLEKHPHDYQSVIAAFIAHSDSINYERQHAKRMAIAEFSKFRRKQNGK